MLRILLKSKIHRVAVTHCELHYEGSCAIDENLLAAANIVDNEQCHIWNINNGERFITYAIKGERGTGMISVNGSAARRAAVGDLITIAAFAQVHEDQVAQHRPHLVRTFIEQPVTVHRPARASTSTAEGLRDAQDVQALFELPFSDLLHRAQTVHRENFDPTMIEFATLLRSRPAAALRIAATAHRPPGTTPALKHPNLWSPPRCCRPRRAKDAGATRFCMGAAWRAPKDHEIEKVAELVAAVKSVGLETCATLGMLEDGHAEALRDAGLDYYNHNLDSAPDFYGDIITTRDYQDRLDTLGRVRGAGVMICCGGIVGIGESREQRAGLIVQLANLDPYPESVPINHLVRVKGAPLADEAPLDPFEFVRTIAVARITMPKARMRLSVGRQQMGDAVQSLCFLVGANSIFYGDKLLTTGNPDTQADLDLLARLGLKQGQPLPLA